MGEIYSLYGPLLSEKIRNVKIVDLSTGNTYFHTQNTTGAYDIKIEHPTKITFLLAHTSQVVLELTPKLPLFKYIT